MNTMKNTAIGLVATLTMFVSLAAGDSRGVFQIDNLVWRGDVAVDEPTTLVLLGLGFAALRFRKRR